MAHEGSRPIRKAKVEMFEVQLNHFIMYDDEAPHEMFNKLKKLVNKARALGSKKWTDRMLMKRLMMAHTLMNYIIVALIRQDPTYKKMSSDDVLGRIMNHEMNIQLALSSDQGSSEGYPEIGVCTCGSSADISRLICMVAPNKDQPCHSSSGYPTIRRSEASDARTPSTGLIRNLNLDFNAVRVQAIMETIQRMAPDGSILALLAQQGAEAANLVVAEKLTGIPRREPSGGHNDRARHAQSEVASSFSPNQRLAGNDAQRRITQNRNVREYGRDWDDF
jgi:hypothetical protein